MDTAKVQYEFVNYEGAVHSFTNPGADSFGKKFNMPFAYNEKADKDSWQQMQKVFKRVFNNPDSIICSRILNYEFLIQIVRLVNCNVMIKILPFLFIPNKQYLWQKNLKFSSQNLIASL